MHVHNVYFWLKGGDPDAAFETGLTALVQDQHVKGGHFGRPSSTARDVVENGYTYGLVLVFDDLAAHDAYQAGAAHLRFLEHHAEKWNQVVVYDLESSS